jgi:hypothetical protein
LDVIKGHETVNASASAYGGHPVQMTHWEHQLESLKVELDWLKKATLIS